MRTAVGLGSNLGDRLANLKAAAVSLREMHCGPGEFAVSPVYETAPVGCEPESPAFWNAVVAFEFGGLPSQLMDRLQQIERTMGRPSKRPRNAPRPIDLDILHCGNLVLNNREIIVPHPRLHLRRFVLQPLADIEPDRVLPGRTSTVADLLSALDDDSPVARLEVAFP